METYFHKKNIIGLLIKLWKDENGGANIGGIAGGAMSGGSVGSSFGPVGTVVGAIGGGILGGSAKKKQKEEIYDPYAAQREQYKAYLASKLGTNTEYSDNPAFNLDKPEVESETEKAILGGLRNLPQKRKDIQGIYGKYAEAEKASARAQQEIEQRKLGDRYNRLGLVSSTPGLQASTDLGRQQGIDLNLIDSRVNKDAVQAEMDSTRLAEEIANSYMTQGRELGSKQRGYQAYSQGMSMDDLIRKIQEEQFYTSSMGSLIGANPPERTVSSTPNTSMELLSLLQNIGGNQGSLSALGGK